MRERSPGQAPDGVTAARTVEADGAVVNASLQGPEAPVLAGGLLTVVWELRATAGGPVYVALGGDRARGRLAAFSFTAALEDADVVFTDPAGDAVDLGGPVGVQPVTAAGLPVPVLVNQFVTLESARQAIPPGGTRLLLLEAQWDVSLSPRPVDVLSAPSQPVKLELRVPLHRDDASLASALRSEVEAVLQAEREDADALARVTAFRHPDTATVAAEIGGDPDRLAWLTAALRR